MSDNLREKIERLERLPDEVGRVFELLMRDPDFKPSNTASQWGWGESTIRRHLTVIYNTLGVDESERDKRGWVVREYSEAYRERYRYKEAISPDNTPEEPKIEGISVKPSPPRVNRNFRIIAILGGFLLISIIVIVSLLATLRRLNTPNPVFATAPVDSHKAYNPPSEPTPYPTDMPQPTLPPVIMAQPTNTSAPVPTAIPTSLPPAIPLPFSDSMSSGMASSWKVLSGNWIATDGKTTITDENHYWGKIVLDDPRWTNYTIRFNVNSFDGSFDQIIVFLRYQSHQTKFLVYDLSAHFYGGNFAYFDGNDVERLTDVSNIGHLPDKYSVEINVSGNTYTARINGQQTQTISVNGYDNGGVGIGINCYYRPCTGISDFEVIGQ